MRILFIICLIGLFLSLPLANLAAQAEPQYTSSKCTLKGYRTSFEMDSQGNLYLYDRYRRLLLRLTKHELYIDSKCFK